MRDLLQIDAINTKLLQGCTSSDPCKDIAH